MKELFSDYNGWELSKNIMPEIRQQWYGIRKMLKMKIRKVFLKEIWNGNVGQKILI